MRVGTVLAALETVLGSLGSADPSPDTSEAWGSGGALIKCMQTAVDEIAAQFEDDLQSVISKLYDQLATYRGSARTWLGNLKTLITNIVIEQVHADNQLPAKTIALALTELIRQMVATSDSVNASTVSVSSATGSGNQGDGVCCCSVLRWNGANSEYAFDEDITLTCSADSQTGATLASETFAVAGEAAQADTLAYDWPAGSACTGTLTAVDADGTANLLTNGSFDDITANIPDDWDLIVGTAGTDIAGSGSSAAYGATGNAVQFTGTGSSPLDQIRQALDVTALKPNTVYMGCVRLKRSGSLAAGVLALDLYNGSAVITDDASTSNSKSITLSGLTTSYAATLFTFVTPKNLPAAVYFRVRLTTAITSGESVYIDHLAFAEADQLYTGGPYATLFSGKTEFIAGDVFTLTVSNSLGKFQKSFERLFGMRALDLQLPSNAGGAETLPDSLIA